MGERRTDHRKRRRQIPSRSSASSEKPSACSPREELPEVAKALEV
jgi:hypothetical protein